MSWNDPGKNDIPNLVSFKGISRFIPFLIPCLSHQQKPQPSGTSVRSAWGSSRATKQVGGCPPTLFLFLGLGKWVSHFFEGTPFSVVLKEAQKGQPPLTNPNMEETHDMRFFDWLLGHDA